MLDLPIDVFHLFFRHLGVPDVLNFRQTCKSLHLVTQSRLVWQTLLMTLASQQIPLPHLSNQQLEVLSSADLENHVRKAWALHRNWTSPSPIARKQSTIKVNHLSTQEGGMVPVFEFIPGDRQRYLIALVRTSDTADGPLYDLGCWDLKTSPPKCVAHRTLNLGWFVVNRSPDSLARLAIQSPDIELLGIDYSVQNPSSGFYTVSKSPNTAGRLVAFNGSLIVTRTDENQLYVKNLESGTDQVELRSHHPTLEQVLEVVIQGDIVIVARATRLEIFTIAGLDTSQKPALIAQHAWQWSLDSISISPQKTWPLGSEPKYPAFNILIRFGSRLPWPVNLIHHFVLLPNIGYRGGEPHSPNNVPYSTIPVVRRLIGSPVRLFSKYHMAIGSHGTAVWIDSHTEDYFGRGDCGQRLAGSRPLEILDVEDEDFYEDSNEMESSMDSSVFGYCEYDEWGRVAVDEEEGRIAIGHLNSTIVVHEYA
ncbi:hypothetical protein DXG01_000804 [Tephrocybe rancida]|nr:hypothetical protein DXG01_000804 [Tephrocybe rancida]